MDFFDEKEGFRRKFEIKKSYEKYKTIRSKKKKKVKIKCVSGKSLHRGCDKSELFDAEGESSVQGNS